MTIKQNVNKIRKHNKYTPHKQEPINVTYKNTEEEIHIKTYRLHIFLLFHFKIEWLR